MTSLRLSLVATAAATAFFAHPWHVSAQETASPPVPQVAPFTYEFYYKVKWGHLDEFLELYKKNHLPILRHQQSTGEILRMTAAFPINHASEADRWDFRMTVIYRDAIVAHEDPTEQPWVKELFPDQAAFEREEQRRFELLIEHMDIPIAVEDVETW